MLNELAQLLCDRFRGREDHYAIQLADGSYRPQKGAFNIDIARGHLQESLTVGVYVLRTDNTVHFAALDFDEPQFGGRALMEQAVMVASRTLTHMQLPHILERSGRKGYHLWVFFAVPVQAAFAREFLSAIHAQMEEALEIKCPVEFFPKQDSIEKEGLGNLIKVPWGKHRASGKLALLVDESLQDIPTMEGQRETLETCSPLTVAEVKTFLEEYPPPDKGAGFRKVPLDGKESGVFGKGRVPCTIELMRHTVGDGGRNQRIYDIAVRIYREGVFPEQALQQLVGYNAEKCLPSLGRTEVEGTYKSVYSRGYGDLRCEEMGDFCKGAECAIYRAQHHLTPPEIEEVLEGEKPSINLTDLIKVDTDPPIWKFKVNGIPIQLVGPGLLKYQQFKEAAFQTLNDILTVPRLPKESLQNAWERYLKPLMDSLITEVAPEEASETGRLRSVIEDWATTNARRNANVQDFLETRAVVCLPEYPDMVIFRFESLRTHLERRRIGNWQQHEIWDVLRSMGGKSDVIRVDKKKTVRAVKLPLILEDETREEAPNEA